MIYTDHQDSSRSPNLRCSRPLCSSQHTVGAVSQQLSLRSRPAQRSYNAERRRPVPQDPTACTCPASPTPLFLTAEAAVLDRDRSSEHQCQCSTHELTTGRRSRPKWLCAPKGEMLLRKEVIQPHLPVRLPCYDLVLITDPTFDGSLHKG